LQLEQPFSGVVSSAFVLEQLAHFRAALSAAMAAKVSGIVIVNKLLE
jgi:hypothetical protein